MKQLHAANCIHPWSALALVEDSVGKCSHALERHETSEPAEKNIDAETVSWSEFLQET